MITNYFTFAGNLSCLEERARLSANLLKLILTQIGKKHAYKRILALHCKYDDIIMGKYIGTKSNFNL